MACLGYEALKSGGGEKKKVLRTLHNDVVKVYFSKTRRLHSGALKGWPTGKPDKALLQELS